MTRGQLRLVPHADREDRVFQFVEQRLAGRVIDIQDGEAIRIQVFEQAGLHAAVTHHRIGRVRRIAADVRQDGGVESQAGDTAGRQASRAQFHNRVRLPGQGHAAERIGELRGGWRRVVAGRCQRGHGGQTADYADPQVALTQNRSQQVRRDRLAMGARDTGQTQFAARISRECVAQFAVAVRVSPTRQVGTGATISRSASTPAAPRRTASATSSWPSRSCSKSDKQIARLASGRVGDTG